MKLRLSIFLFLFSFVAVQPASLLAASGRDSKNSSGSSLLKLFQRFLDEDRLDDAEKLLGQVEAEEADLEGLWGVLALRRANYQEAVKRFTQVLKLAPQKNGTWLYLGQAHYELREYEKAAQALAKGEASGKNILSWYLLYSRAERESGDLQQAFLILKRAKERFPEEVSVVGEIAEIYLRGGLYAHALQMGRDLVFKSSERALWVAESLRQAARLDYAITLLEELRLASPENPQIIGRLALCYSASDKHRAAGRLLAPLAKTHAKLAYAAAEEFRLADETRRALAMNALVSDKAKQLRQRITILVEARLYDRALTLLGDLEALGSVDDTMLYRLAFAALELNELALAKKLAAQIKDEQLHQSLSSLISESQST